MVYNLLILQVNKTIIKKEVKSGKSPILASGAKGRGFESRIAHIYKNHIRTRL